MEHTMGKGPEDFLASYGADRARWPEEVRVTAGRGSPGLEAEAAAIDQLLNLASQPPVPAGAIERFLDKLPDAPSAAVLAFRPRPLARPAFVRYAALPLAASLALGIYLGAQGDLDVVFPAAITGTVALGDEVDEELGGIGELEAFAEENVT